MRKGGLFGLTPDGPDLKYIDCGTLDICLLTPVSWTSTFFRKSLTELRGQSCSSMASTIYVRASERSFRGKRKLRKKLASVSLGRDEQGSAQEEHLSNHNGAETEIPETQPGTLPTLLSEIEQISAQQEYLSNHNGPKSKISKTLSVVSSTLLSKLGVLLATTHSEAAPFSTRSARQFPIIVIVHFGLTEIKVRIVI